MALSTIEFPWLHSQSPPRLRPLSIFNRILVSRTPATVDKRVGSLLPPKVVLSSSVTSFVAASLPALLNTINGSDKSNNVFIHKAISKRFREGRNVLVERKLVPTVKLVSTDFKPKVSSMHVTYGSIKGFEDASQGYLTQRWSRAVSLRIPQEDSVFESTDQQKKVLKSALKDGCVLSVGVFVAGDFEYIVENQISGEVLERDKRGEISLVLTSNHSTEWSESNLQWRIDDVDGLLGRTV
ncbi:hypothetical protein BDR26DRAFT_894772 [Obelidium mucronatum]|nr:hypothetical protein BDR26DRAFT_894772 [Obelidium mucronatum]